MMDFSDSPKRENTENIVPMINVVFLLLIFFLMTAQIAPPEPFEVTSPEAADGQDSEGVAILYLAATGETAFEDLRGEAALERFASIDGDLVRVDANLPAADLAKTLSDLRVLGVTKLGLITVTP